MGSPLSWSSVTGLVVEGPDPAEFLQGYVTCNTQRLQAGKTLPMAFCNLKGRVIANGWLVPRGKQCVLIVHRSIVETLRTFLRPYLAFARSEILSQELMVHVATSDQMAAGDYAWLAGHYLRLAEPAGTPPGAADSEEPYSTEAVTINPLLIQQRFALVNAAVADRFLPQMLGMADSGAVDFDKGCYLGQEIVARAEFRGQVKKQLQSFQWQGEPPVAGAHWLSPEPAAEAAQNGEVILTGLTAAKAASAAPSGTGLWVTKAAVEAES